MVRAALVGSDRRRREAVRAALVRDGRYDVVSDGDSLASRNGSCDCVVMVEPLSEAGAWAQVAEVRTREPGAVVCAVSWALPSPATPADTFADDLHEFVTGEPRARHRHERRAELALPASTASAREARRFVSALLADWGCHGLVDSAVLLVSELVTNAVIHAGSPLDLQVSLRAGSLTVEVAERGEGEVRRVDAKPTDESGRGLGIVAAEARRWGMMAARGRRVMWFELP